MKKESEKSQRDVEAYLDSLPVDARNALEHLRKMIRAAVPNAEEGFSYGVPAFKLYGKPIVCYAAFKNHCGFYPMSPNILSRFNADLAKFETSKGTIRFKIRDPIPDEIVERIVKARMEELEK